VWLDRIDTILPGINPYIILSLLVIHETTNLNGIKETANSTLPKTADHNILIEAGC